MLQTRPLLATAVRICLLVITTTLVSCSSGLDPATDLTGTWEGNAPNGALYTDNVANPACSYAADIRIVFVQSGESLTGSFTLTVRSATQLLSLPCVPVGTSSNEALFAIPVPSGIAEDTEISRQDTGVPATGRRSNARQLHFGRHINSVRLYLDGSRWWITCWMFDGERAHYPVSQHFLLKL